MADEAPSSILETRPGAGGDTGAHSAPREMPSGTDDADIDTVPVLRQMPLCAAENNPEKKGAAERAIFEERGHLIRDFNRH